MTDVACCGKAGDPDADRDRQFLRVAEAHAQSLEPRTHPFGSLLRIFQRRASQDEQELVGAVARHLATPCGRLVPDDSGHAEQYLVRGGVAVGVVEEPEVVDIDQGDRDRRTGCVGRFHFVRQGGHHRPVVEHAGEGIPARRLQQLGVLPAEPRLRGSEYEEQHRCEENARGERDKHDVASRAVEACEEGIGVAPHGDDGEGVSVRVDDRKEFLHQVVSLQPISGGVRGHASLDQVGARLALGQRAGHGRRWRHHLADRVASVAGNDAS